MRRCDHVLDVVLLMSFAPAQINCASQSLARLLLLTGIAGRECSLTPSEKCSSVLGAVARIEHVSMQNMDTRL